MKRKPSAAKKRPATAAPLVAAPMSSHAFATLLGVHRNTVANWIKAEPGLPATRRGRVTEVDVVRGLLWVREQERAALEARIAAATEKPDFERERFRKMSADADLAEMARDQKRGELVSQVEAERAWSTHVLQVRARLLSLPSHARVRGLDAGAVAIVEELIHKALESLTESDPEQDENDEAAGDEDEEDIA